MDKGIVLMILLYGSMFLLAGFIWIGFSTMEARAYNRVTGQQVSTLDAMFLQLRVQEAVGR